MHATEPASPPEKPLRSALRRPVQIGLALALLVASGSIGYNLSERYGLANLRRESSHKLDLFAAAVDGVVRRLEHVPATIQLNPDVLSLLRAPKRPERRSAVNTYLRQLNAHLGSMSVFVMDERGIVLASSNADQGDDSLVGEDLSFRPYFLDALSGRVGRHFAIGTRGNAPGYFVSHPIHDGARVVGVATIKISLAPVEQTWEMLGAPALLADAHQIVILSSEPAWRYTALSDLTAEQRVDLQLSRLFNTQRIAPFPLTVELTVDPESQELEGRLNDTLHSSRQGSPGTLVRGRALDGMDWRLLMFPDLRDVHNQALVHGMLATLAAGFVLLLAVSFHQRRRILRQKLEAKQMLERANADLEQKVTRRTRALSDTNTRLRKEVQEREQAEKTLRAAQDELVHAAKMAVLGQLATGITHELTQPLGGIRTLSGNASEFLRRGDLKAVESNLGIVARLADQMGQIIEPMKGYARKSAAVSQPTDVARALDNALFLYGQRLRKEQVTLRHDSRPGEVTAWCDPNRLEQVLVNLIGNALDAMKDRPERILTLSTGTRTATHAHRVWIRVEDTGAGFDDVQRQRLFEPFFTTKAGSSGLGLGLAISRDIVREFGGDIDAVSLPKGGACFTVYLPKPPAEDEHDS